VKYLKVAELSEIPAGHKKKVTVRGKDILLVNVDGNYYALNNSCPHRGKSLAAGRLANQVLTCPRHGAAFDVKTGHALSDARSLFGRIKVKDCHSYPVQVHGNDLLIAWDPAYDEAECPIIEKGDQLEHVLKDYHQAILLFYTSWCPYSQRFLPIFEKYSSGQLNFFRVLLDKQEELTDQYGISVYPTVLFYENGVCLKRLAGVAREGLQEGELIGFIAACNLEGTDT